MFQFIPIFLIEVKLLKESSMRCPDKKIAMHNLSNSHLHLALCIIFMFLIERDTRLLLLFKNGRLISGSVGLVCWIEYGHLISKHDLPQQSQLIILSGLPPMKGIPSQRNNPHFVTFTFLCTYLKVSTKQSTASDSIEFPYLSAGIFGLTLVLPDIFVSIAVISTSPAPANQIASLVFTSCALEAVIPCFLN